jgi:hypothetical protein
LLGLFFDNEDGEGRFLWSVGKLLPYYTASHHFSYPLQLEFQIPRVVKLLLHVFWFSAFWNLDGMMAVSET